MSKKDLKICCISSHGGHLHEMMAAMEGVDGNIVWLTHKTKASQITLQDKPHHYILDPNVSKIKFGINAIQALWHLILERPKVVMSTGSGIAIPTMLFAKYLFGAKLVFVESAASVVLPSKTGKFMYKYCDLFIIQWESLKEFFPNAKYVGVL